MKVLVISTDISTESGGLKTGTINLCKAMLENGYEVCIFTTSSEESLKIQIIEGVRVVTFKRDFSFLGNNFSLGLLIAIHKELINFDLVVIQSMYQIASNYTAFIARKRNIPYVLRPHGTLDPVLFHRRRTLLKKIYIRLFDRRDYQAAAAIQYSSLVEQEMTIKNMRGISKGVIIGEGIDINHFKEMKSDILIRDLYPFLRGKIALLFVGRIHQKKGIELALEAMRVLRKNQDNLHLLIVGTGDSNYVNEIQGLIKRHQISDCVTMLGMVDESLKIELLRGSDIFLCPSYGENFGISVVEAAAIGLPIITTNMVAIAKVLDISGAAIVTNCNVVEISNAIERLAGDQKLREKMKIAGINIVEQEFSLSSMAEKIQSTYPLLINK